MLGHAAVSLVSSGRLAGRILCTRLVVAAPRMTHGFRPIVAVDVFQQVDAPGERITLGLVERRLAELAASAGLPVCLLRWRAR